MKIIFQSGLLIREILGFFAEFGKTKKFKEGDAMKPTFSDI